MFIVFVNPCTPYFVCIVAVTVVKRKEIIQLFYHHYFQIGFALRIALKFILYILQSNLGVFSWSRLINT